MTDCCQDKTSPYEIRPEDHDLFAAAIAFGDWLAEVPSASSSEIAAIREMQSFLRSLPSAPPPDFNAEFGFRIESNNENDDQGHFGSWSVSVCRAMLEIGCCGHDTEPEFSWLLCPGWKNDNNLQFAQDWIKQVANPLALIGKNQLLVVEASRWSVEK